MHTIRLNMDEKSDFISTQKYLKTELDEIDNRNATFISKTDLENRLDKLV